MGLTADELAGAARRLLPRGYAWATWDGSVLQRVLLAAGDELARLFGAADQLLDEAHPMTLVDSLDDWERELGLPSPCVTETLTDDERRAAVVARVAAVGGQSPDYYIGVAESLVGAPITIVEHSAFEMGVSGMGDGLGNWAYAWTIHAAAALTSAQRQLLECELGALKPAHTALSFTYDLE